MSSIGAIAFLFRPRFEFSGKLPASRPTVTQLADALCSFVDLPDLSIDATGASILEQLKTATIDSQFQGRHNAGDSIQANIQGWQVAARNAV
jgi:hypothetical protein